MSDELLFTWAVPRSFAPELRRRLAECGAELEPVERAFTPPRDEERDYSSGAFEPLVVLAGVIAAAYVLEKVLGAVREAKHGGAIADVRPGHVDVRSNPSVPPETVVIAGADGAEAHNAARPEAAARAFARAMGR